MDNFFTTIKKFTELNDFCSVLSVLREKEKAGEIVLYAGTYSFESALARFGNYDKAYFYIYTASDRGGYCVYKDRMGSGIREDDEIFAFSHRYLYNKNHLSNRFFGEKDYRCGEYFQKGLNKIGLSVKNMIINGWVEFAIELGAILIGIAIVCLFPLPIFEEWPELAMLIGAATVVGICGLVALVIHLIKRKNR